MRWLRLKKNVFGLRFSGVGIGIGIGIGIGTHSVIYPTVFIWNNRENQCAISFGKNRKHRRKMRRYFCLSDEILSCCNQNKIHLSGHVFDFKINSTFFKH